MGKKKNGKKGNGRRQIQAQSQKGKTVRKNRVTPLIDKRKRVSKLEAALFADPITDNWIPTNPYDEHKSPASSFNIAPHAPSAPDWRPRPRTGAGPSDPEDEQKSQSAPSKSKRVRRMLRNLDSGVNYSKRSERPIIPHRLSGHAENSLRMATFNANKKNLYNLPTLFEFCAEKSIDVLCVTESSIRMDCTILEDHNYRAETIMTNHDQGDWITVVYNKNVFDVAEGLKWNEERFGNEKHPVRITLYHKILNRTLSFVCVHADYNDNIGTAFALQGSMLKSCSEDILLGDFNTYNNQISHRLEYSLATTKVKQCLDKIFVRKNSFDGRIIDDGFFEMKEVQPSSKSPFDRPRRKSANLASASMMRQTDHSHLVYIDIAEPAPYGQELLREDVVGYRTIDISNDGHCLFRAIATSMNNGSIGTNHDVLALRQAAQYIIQNNETMQASMAQRASGNPYSTRINELHLMKNNIVWGGEDEIHALSIHLQRNIILHHQEGMHIFNGASMLDPAAYSPDDNDLHICLGESGRHYNALIRK